MKRFDLLQSTTFLILAYGIFSGSTCFSTATDEIDSKDGCGDKATWEREFKWDQFRHTTIKDGRRYFYYEDTSTPTNICINKHTTAVYEVLVKNQLTVGGLSTYGYAYWGIYNATTVLLFNTSGLITTYKGTEEIGLKQVPSPASIGLQVQVVFQTRGQYSEDVKFLDSCVSNVYIHYTYYKVE